MDVSSMSKILFITLSVLICQQSGVGAQAVNFVNSGCTGTYGNYTEGSVYQQNLNQLFSNLSSRTLHQNFYNSTHGNFPYRVYGLYLCRPDLSLDVCANCIQDATERIVQECPLYGEAVVWYYECMLRYANRTIFSLSLTSPSAYRWNTNNVSNTDEFLPVLAATMNRAINQALDVTPWGHYGTADANYTLFDTIYCQALCTSDMDRFGCNLCLRSALAEMSSCCRASLQVMVAMPSCQLRYALYEFYNVTTQTLPPPLPPQNTPTDSPDNGKGLKPAIIVGIAVGAAAGVLLLLFALWWYLYPRPKEPKQKSKLLESEATSKPDDIPSASKADSFGNVEFVQYDLDTLKAATGNFSRDNKLGEGGFGIVYKGCLDNGQMIAIKRLSGDSGQGAKEFMTEARLVAKLQHKNLVKILGFCSQGEEKMLVYEFLPNSSLDRFLFDPRKRFLLNWEIRHKIIMGIARGLQYLHEDSRLKIIHRDLKPNNILLDEDMNPKIADFGLAKLFGGEQTLGNTSHIVGTHAYMAPEYLLTGEYSEKSDVYSFGIIILELLSGQKNKIYYQASQQENLPIFASRLWNAGRSLELIDPTLYDSAPSKEIVRCIQIGLLCVQKYVEERPTMATVVLMLNGSITLPVPSRPDMSLSPYQLNQPRRHNDFEQSISKSVSWTKDLEQDLYPR